MSTIIDMPAVRPSLLLDFANSGRLDPRIQCTRASAATYRGPDGRLRTAAANVPRIDYDHATGRCLGLLIEGARTNLAYPSNMPTSTVQTTTGVMQANGATKITSGIEAPDGSLGGFAVEGAGVASNNNGANNVRIVGVAALAGAHTVSLWIRAQVATSVFIREASSGTIFQFATKSTWERITATITTTMANQNIIIFSDGGARFEVFGVQVEEGAFSTSYIPATTAPATRAADSVSLSVPDLDNECSIVCAFEPRSRSDSWPCAFTVGPESGAAGANVLRVFCASTNTQARLPGNIVIATGAAVVLNDTNRLAVAVSVARSAFALSGVLVGSTVDSFDRSQLKRLYIGSQGGTGGFLNGCVRQISVYPRALPDAQIRRLTA